MKRTTVHHTKIAGFANYDLWVSLWRPEKPIAVVVLIHGVVSHSRWFEPLCRRLYDNGIYCIAPDRRGSGRNLADRGDTPGTQALIDDLYCVISHFHDPSLPLHLAGFCWGANYAVHYALAGKSDLTSLCLIAPSLFPSQKLQQTKIHAGESAVASEEPVTPIELFTAGPQYRRFILPDPLRLRAVSPRFNAVLQKMSQMIGVKFLKQTIPTLVLLADRDEMVDNAATEKAFHKLKSSRKLLTYLPGAHGIQFDAPDLLTATLCEWVRGFDQWQPR